MHLLLHIFPNSLNLFPHCLGHYSIEFFQRIHTRLSFSFLPPHQRCFIDSKKGRHFFARHSVSLPAKTYLLLKGNWLWKGNVSKKVDLSLESRIALEVAVHFPICNCHFINSDALGDLFYSHLKVKTSFPDVISQGFELFGIALLHPFSSKSVLCTWQRRDESVGNQQPACSGHGTSGLHVMRNLMSTSVNGTSRNGY